MIMELKNKVIVVTGASGGIGSAIVRSLAEKKCRIVLHYADDENSVKI